MVARAAALMVVVVVGLPFGALYAAEEAAPPKDAGLREARGPVQSVDKEHNRVVLDQSKGAALTLQLDKATTIFIDGRTGTLDEIKAGSEIRASYETRQGNNKAQWIEISKREKKPGQSQEKLPEAPMTPPPPVPRTPPVD